VVSYWIDFSIHAYNVIENSISVYSRPRIFRNDNGSEFREKNLNLFLSNYRIKHKNTSLKANHTRTGSAGFSMLVWLNTLSDMGFNSYQFKKLKTSFLPSFDSIIIKDHIRVSITIFQTDIILNPVFPFL